MNKISLETTDIFKGAFFMCMGGSLNDLKFRNNGKMIASFLFTGPELNKHDQDYMNGQALVNPLQFREALNHLRDILFKNIRKNGGLRYDRTRKNRPHQKNRQYC